MSQSTLHPLDVSSAISEDCAVSGSYHLRVKVGVAEFDCEGPSDLVRDDYREFLELIDRIGAKAIEGRADQSLSKTPLLEDVVDDIAKEPISENAFSAWERVYMQKEDKLSLNMIPDTPAPNSDSILLIIYGYQKLFQLEGVSATVLMEAAKQSGLRIDRIDRNVSSEHNKFLLKGGSGKGSRYSLNNRGLNYVSDLLGHMFE